VTPATKRTRGERDADSYDDYADTLDHRGQVLCDKAQEIRQRHHAADSSLRNTRSPSATPPRLSDRTARQVRRIALEELAEAGACRGRHRAGGM